jgi:UDP-glucuronate 4-epimerase
MPSQSAEMRDCYADIAATTRDFGFAPKVGLEDGLQRFADWYKSYYAHG